MSAPPVDPLDAVAAALRERLLRDPSPEGGGETAIRAMVDAEAGVLAADQREELVRRIAERSFGVARTA